MDRKQLENSLKPFRDACESRGLPLEEICIYPAYSGDISSSYIIQIKANWVDEMECFAAIDSLFDILRENSDENIRKNIFSIEILDSNDQLHCHAENSRELEKDYKV